MKSSHLFFILICLFLTSCIQKNTEQPIDETVINKHTKDRIKAPEYTPETQGNSLEKTVTYESAAVYAAATEYGFMDEEGKLILVRYNEYPDKNEKNPIIPAYLLESGDDLEGPPEANPEMVGKEFILVYDENEKIIEIKK